MARVFSRPKSLECEAAAAAAAATTATRLRDDARRPMKQFRKTGGGGGQPFSIESRRWGIGASAIAIPKPRQPLANSSCAPLAPVCSAQTCSGRALAQSLPGRRAHAKGNAAQLQRVACFLGADKTPWLRGGANQTPTRRSDQSLARRAGGRAGGLLASSLVGLASQPASRPAGRVSLACSRRPASQSASASAERASGALPIRARSWMCLISIPVAARAGRPNVEVFAQNLFGRAPTLGAASTFAPRAEAEQARSWASNIRGAKNTPSDRSH